MPHPNPPRDGRGQQRVQSIKNEQQQMVAQMQLFCPAFSIEKLSLCQGDEPLAAEGVKETDNNAEKETTGVVPFSLSVK